MDIDVYLEAGDLEKLKGNILLKTELVDDSRKKINKYLTLRLGENEEIDGFDFRKIRDDKKSGWESILGYEVAINQWAYDHILRQGHFGTRYDGENKITVYTKKSPF